MPVYFPSLAEPVITTQQYLDFANLQEGSAVIDLGAYSGLTSIIFKEAVKASGTVIAVEADAQNIIGIQKNLSLYKKITNNPIELIYGAVWSHNNGLNFSSEGNMGSSASEIVGNGRGYNLTVESYTLSKIAAISKLEQINFIKCDVEGAENVIFEDKNFFSKFRPRIIIETHFINGIETTGKCIEDLESLGYRCRRIIQKGVQLPLLECHP
jgi:FkbM family methyltransferase